MAGIVSQVHKAFAVELYTVRGAAFRKGQKQFGTAVRLHQADRAILPKVDNIEVTLLIESGSFNVIGEQIFRRVVRRNIQFLTISRYGNQNETKKLIYLFHKQGLQPLIFKPMIINLFDMNSSIYIRGKWRQKLADLTGKVAYA